MNKSNKSTRKNRQGTRYSTAYIKRLSCWLVLSTALTIGLNRVAEATSSTWNGTVDGTWAGANWSQPVVPGSGETATFDNAGGGFTTIDLGAGVTVNALVFNTAAAAGYTIGFGAVNNQTLTLNNGGSITVNASAVNPQTFNAALTLGTDSTTAAYTFTNNSASALTFAGNIVGGSTGVAGTKTLTVTGAGNTAISGAIGNGGATAVALTKSGNGILTLSGVNGYSGLTTIQGGSLVLDANGGSGSIGGAALTISGGGGTFEYKGAAAGSTQAFSGALTFSAGAGTVKSTYGTSGNTSLTFGSLAARTAGATGNFVVSGGANGTTNQISFTTIAAGFQNQGLFFNGADYAFANAANSYVRGIDYATDGVAATTGAGATIGAVSTKHVQTTGAITGQTTLSIATLKISGANNFNINTAQTLTLTSGGLLKAGNNSAVINGGTLTSTATELVIRADQASDVLNIGSVLAGTLTNGLTITGAGTVNLSQLTNTFTGTNIFVNGATLRWLGSNSSADPRALGAAGARTITVTNGGTLSPTVTSNPVASSKTFVIGTGGGVVNVIAGTIFSLDDAGQFGGTGNLTVTGTGNGIFNVGNAATPSAFTGNIAVNSGILQVRNGAGALGTGTGRSIAVANGAMMDLIVTGLTSFDTSLSGAGVNNAGALTNSSATAVTWAAPITLAANASIGSTAAGGLTLTSPISGGFSLTKVGTGAGALTLSGLNAYTGNTIVNGGILIADSATNAAPINSASGLVFSGSGIFRYTGLAATARAMTLNGLTLAGGAGILDVNNTGTSTQLTLDNITRGTGGGSVDFRATTGTVGTTSLANFASGANVNGILGGFATVNSGSNLAALDGSKNVVAYSAYTDIDTNGSTIADGAATNVRIQTVNGAGNIALGGVTTTDINTLFQNTATAVTVDTAAKALRLGTQGGILTSPTASTTGTVTIGTAANSGTLTAGGADNTAGEIIVNTALATPVTINSVIADNGTGVVSLTRTGLTATTLTLNGTNTFSGPLSILSGTVVLNTSGLANINTASAIGKGSVAGSAADLVLNGGTLQFTTSTVAQSTDRLFSVGLGNGTLDASGGTGGTLSFIGTGAIGFNGQSGSRTLTLTGTNTGNNLLTPVLGDNGGPTHLTKSAAGKWILAGNNTYTGTTTVSGGTLQVGNGGTSGSIGSGYVTGAGTISFNRSDNVTLTNMFAGLGSTGLTLNLGTATTLSLNNGDSGFKSLTFNGADGGVIDLLADIAIGNNGGTNINAVNSGTINANGGGRIILNGLSDDTIAAAGKTLTINAVIASGLSSSFEALANATGTVYLTANNTFTTLQINSGILQVDAIRNQNIAGPLGAGTTIGMAANSAMLKYSGLGETTDRIISLTGTTVGGGIDQSGVSGLLRFTTNFAAPGAGAKTLTLQGSTAGTGEISGIISDNSANVNTTAITKSGSGTWTLSGANTYTGTTAINGGALILGLGTAAQNSVVTSTVANSTTTGLVFGTGVTAFSIGGLGGSQNLALTNAASVALTALTIGGTNTSNATYSGILSGTANITKAGTNTQVLSGVSTMTGKMIITGGTLSISNETNLGGNPGISTADQLTISGGTLAATENFTIDDANRGVQLGNGVSGTGTIDVATLKTLVVQNAISGTLGNLVKTGAGTLVLNTTPTYTGTTAINAGRIQFGTGAVFPAGALSFGGGGLLYYTSTPDITTQVVTLNAGGLTVDVVPAATTVTYANAANLGNSGVGGLTKVGAGNLSLAGGVATYTGGTVAGAGVLQLNFGDGTAGTVPASNIINSASTLTLQGGTVRLNGMTVGTSAANSQTFASTSLAAGASVINNVPGTATSVTANLGVLTRTAGATVQFQMPNATTTLANVSTTVANSAGILGGWATYGTAAGTATSWAVKDGSNNIIALADGSYTTLTAAGGGTATTTNFTVSLASAVTLTSTGITANSLRITAGGNTLGLATNNMVLGTATGGISSTSGTGGILYSATTGTGTISGTPNAAFTQGFITVPATTGDLPIFVSTGGTLTISAGIGATTTGSANAFGITKSGGGTLNLTNSSATQANNYTGVTTINGGTLSIDAANRLGLSTGITLNGGTLNVSANQVNVTQALTLGLNGGSLTYNSNATGNGGWTNATAITFLGSGSRTLTLGGNTSNGTNTNRIATLTGALGDSGGPTSLTINGTSASVFELNSAAAQTYSGPTTITGGALRLGTANQLSANSNLVFNGGTANTAVLSIITAGADFTGSLGTTAGQVQWLGNGGFASTTTAITKIVSLGGVATPQALTWNVGGFVPTNSTLQFGFNPLNGTTSSNSSAALGNINFRNAIDLNSASRAVSVVDGNGVYDAILAGVISSTGVGGVLNKSGFGTLQLTANNSASTDTAVTLGTGAGYVVFGSNASVATNLLSIPQVSGVNVTVGAQSGIVLTNSTNPLSDMGARIVTTSAGSIALDVNSSATLDFSAFSALSLGAFNTTIGQPTLFTGSIIPNANTFRLATGRSTSTAAAVTGNALVNFVANVAPNILMLPNANQLADNGGTPRSLVAGAGATYLGSYNTFTGGTTLPGASGANAVVALGHDAALGSGLVNASTAFSYIGALNGDRTLSNNVTTVGGNWVAAANLASDGVTNSGAMTYLGKVTLGSNTNIFARTNAAIFLGDIAAAGTIGPQTTGYVSFLGAKTFNSIATSLADGANLVIDNAASIGTGTGNLTIGSSTLRVQPGAGAITLPATRTVAITNDKSPTFTIMGGDTLTLLGPLTGGGGLTAGRTFLKNGLGTLKLAPVAVTTYQAQTTNQNTIRVDGGELVLDAGNITAVGTIRVLPDANLFPLILGNSANGTLSNGGSLRLVGNALNTKSVVQGFGVLTLAQKENRIVLEPIALGGTVGLNLTSITRGNSAVLALTMPASSTISLTTGGAGVANTIFQDTDAHSYVVIGTAAGSITDWAARDNAATAFNLVTGTTAGIYTANTATALAVNADLSDTAFATVTLAAPTTLTSLRFNEGTTDFTIDTGAANTLTTGGILVGSGTGTRNQLIQGTAALQGTGATSRELIIYQGNTGGNGTTTGLLTISAPIANNGGATTLVKSGPGTLVLSGNNTFTGSIYLNSGVLSFATANAAGATNPNPLGQAASANTNILMNGGTLRYTGAGSTTTDRGAFFNAPSTIEVTEALGTLVITGQMTGITAAVPNNALNKTGAGALSLSGAGDNASLSVRVTNGTLNLDKASSASVHAVAGGTGAAALIVNGGTVKITGTGGDQIFVQSTVVVNGGSFDFNGQSEQFDALGGTGGTVTNTGTGSVTMTLGDATYAGSQTMIGAYTLNAANAGVAATGLNSFSGNITDDGVNKISIVKAGPGLQILAGTGNTYSGDTTVSSGVLRLGALNVLPSGAGEGNVILGNTVIFGVAVPGTLDIGGFNQAINGLTGAAGSIVTNTPATTVSADQTNTIQVGNNNQTSQFDGIFQDGYVVKPGTTPVGYFGFLAVEKVGAGVLTLTGASTNTGTVTITDGRIDLNNATGNALATNVTINTGATLKLLASNQVADAKTVTTSGGTFDLNGKNETVGVVLTGGTIDDGLGGGALSSNSAFDLRAGAVSAKLSGTSGLNKATGGTVTLGGGQTHNFSGATAISAGTLQLSTGASINLSSGVALTGTGKLYVNGSTAAAVPISVASGTTLGGSGTVGGTVTVSATGGIIEAGQSGSGSLTVDTINFGGPGTLNLFNLNTVTASILNVGTTLTTTAGGGNVVTINLTNSGSLDGTTNYGVNGYKLIDVGTLTWGGGNNNFVLGTVTGLGGRSTGTLNFVDNDALYMTVSIVNPIWSGAQSNEWSTAAIAGSKNWYLLPATPTDYIDTPADTVLFDDTATTRIVDISVADVNPNGVTFNFNGADYTLQGTESIMGTTSFVKSGTGTLVINNANGFTGGLVINGGVVKLGNASALGTGNALTFGPAAAAGTKLQLFGNNATVTGLTTNATPGSPVVENGAAVTDSVLTVNLAAGTNTFAGVLQNGAAAKLGLTKQGGGTLILTGTNTADGGNTVSAGTLQIGNGGTAGTLAGNTSIAGSALLDFNRSDASTYAGGITGAGAVTVEGGGTLSITGNVAHSGGTTIDTATTLQIGNGGATGDLSGVGTVTDNGTLAFNRTGSSTVQAPITGTGNLSVGNGTNVGTLILTGGNSYAGTTTINANATLQVGNGGVSGSLGTAASITNNGTFAYDRSDAQTYTTLFNGTGALRVMDGTLTLTGNNNATYSDGTTVDAGASLIVGNVGGTAGAIPGFNAAGTGGLVADGNVTFRRTGTNTFDNAITGAASGAVTLAAGSWTLTNATLSYAGSTTIQSGATLNIAAGSGTGVGPGAIGNAGALIFNRAASYTLAATNVVTGAGSVTLANSGTVATAADGNFNTTGQLIFGSANGATVLSSLDLTNGSSTFGGLLVRTNSTTANTITIGSGKTLAINGAVTVGYSSAAHTNTRLTATGSSGTLTFGAVGAPTNAGVTIGANTTDAFSNGAILDLSALGTFYANLGSGTFRIGDPTNGTGTATLGSTLILAADSTITATTLSAESPDSGVTEAIKLGSGTNRLNVTTLNVGAQNGRSNGTFGFNTTTGTLTIRGLAGGDVVPDNTSRATLNVVNNAFGTGANPIGTFDTTGHTADLRFGTMTIAGRSGSTGIATGTFSFNQGTLDANDLIAGNKTSGSTSTAEIAGTVNLSGGDSTFNSLTNAMQLGVNASTTGGVNAIAKGTLAVSGGTVLVKANGGNSIRLGDATAANGTATGIINVTGGVLTLEGDIIRGATTGTSVATLNLNGGTLDMGGKKIGGSLPAGNLTSLTFASGTLKNAAEINNGAALTKSAGTGAATASTNTLTLAGTNSYTGPTNVNAGTVVVSGSISGSAVAVAASSFLNVAGAVATVAGPVTVSGTLTGGSTDALTGLINNTVTVESGGVVNPGSAVDGANTGILRASTFLAKTGSTLSLRLDSPTAGTGYDQVRTNSAIDLANGGGAGTTLTLDVSNYAFNYGDKFFVVVNTPGIGAVTGTFANATTPAWGFNDTVNFGGIDFAISYTGNFNGGGVGVFEGAGNDVVLMAVPEPNSLAMLAGSIGMALGLQRFRRRRQA